MTKNKARKKLFLIADAVLLCVIAVLVIFTQQKKEEIADSEDNIDAFYSRFITYKGEVYPVIRGLQSILLIGTDNMEENEKPSEIDAYYNDHLADFLVLAVFNHEDKTVTPFQINRDTICDVPILSVNGLFAGYERMQITLSHLFGKGKQDSSMNTVNAVTGLLYGAPVDHYFCFSMDTVPILNDLVGGVTVTLEDDIPALGAKYVKGATIKLKGKEALAFVRTRDRSKVNSNQPRMAHHRLYMDAYIDAARVKIEKNPEFVVDAYDKVERFLNTDLTVENVSYLVNCFYEYEVLPFVTPSGTYNWSSETGLAEFHVDDDSLWDCVHSTFCR